MLILGVRKEQIDQGQPWQNDIETHFNVMRRMADHDSAAATTWGELQAAHERFFVRDNHRAHSAHQERIDDRRSPAAVLGWVHGTRCDPADLDRLFRLRWPRSITPGGSIRFRHWRLSAERGLAGERAAVWVHGQTLTLEDETATIARYRTTLEADGRRPKAVDDPRSSSRATTRPSHSCPAWRRWTGSRRGVSHPTEPDERVPKRVCRNRSSRSRPKMRSCPRLSDALGRYRALARGSPHQPSGAYGSPPPMKTESTPP
jgi:hypothetical protein